MGGVGALRGRRVYLDANVFIYAVEGSPEHAAFLEGLFDLLAAGDAAAVTSELTLAEVLAKPFAERRADLAAIYEEMVAPSAWLSTVPVERAIVVRAARLGPELGLKLPDAIHAASAEAAACEVFLSNDRRLKMPQGIVLAELA
jgi:predicted nucleic acid-binding protein